MPTQLEELVEFLHHGNTQIRQIAVETLVPFSQSQPSLFKSNDRRPIKDLKLLIRDYPQIAHHVITIIINLTAANVDIRDELAADDKFLEDVVAKLTCATEKNADSFCELLTNLSKSPLLVKHLLPLQHKDAPIALHATASALDQLMAVFVKGESGKYNKYAEYDHLAFLFGDLAQYDEFRKYLVSDKSPSDDATISAPLGNLLPFTTHSSLCRRLGVVQTLKNLLFDTHVHLRLMDPPYGLLVYVLHPLCGPDTAYSLEETEKLLPELQFLGQDNKRESNDKVVLNLLECLMLLACGNREVRDKVREAGSYYIVREVHVDVEDEDIRGVCERLVDVLMRDEPSESVNRATSPDDSDDDRVVEIC